MSARARSFRRPRPDRPWRFVVAVPSFPPAFLGGPIRSTEAMVTNTSTPAELYVLTSTRDSGQPVDLPVPADQWIGWKQAQVWYGRTHTIRGRIRTLAELVRLRPDATYANSLFHPVYSIAPAALARIGVLPGAILVAPRGELEPSALAMKSPKKKVALTAMRLTGMHRRTIFHATTEREADLIRDRFPGVDVIVREDETLLPPTALPTTSTRRRFVWIGRIARTKGLDVLLHALAELDDPVLLDIYGAGHDPGYDGECVELAEVARERGHTISFHGAVPHPEVLPLLRGYSAALLPTAGENFCHVIAEALSVSCPVFAPPTTPWSDLLAECGTLVADRDPSTWAAALADFPGDDDPEGLADRHRRAGAAYERWQAAQPAETFADLALAHLAALTARKPSDSLSA